MLHINFSNGSTIYYKKEEGVFVEQPLALYGSANKTGRPRW